jgi:hypothetical protein
VYAMRRKCIYALYNICVYVIDHVLNFNSRKIRLAPDLRERTYCGGGGVSVERNLTDVYISYI